MILDNHIKKYAEKAFSESNRKKFDGNSNARHIVKIEMAEVGDGDGGNFYCGLMIPRKVDNELGGSIIQNIHDREQAKQALLELAEML